MIREQDTIPDHLAQLFTRQAEKPWEILQRNEAEKLVEHATPIALTTLRETIPLLPHVAGYPGELLLNTNRGRGQDYTNIITLRWGKSLPDVHRLERDLSLEIFPPNTLKNLLQRFRQNNTATPFYRRVALHITSSGLDLRFAEPPHIDEEKDSFIGLKDFVNNPLLLPPLLEKVTLFPILTSGQPFRIENPKVGSYIDYGTTQAQWASNGAIIQMGE